MSDALGDLRGRARWVVFGCLLCQMGLGFGYGVNALAPYVLEEFGWSRALFASAQAPQLFVIAVASPLVGWAVGRYGARSVLAIASLLFACAAAMIAGMQAFWHYALAWALLGLAVTGLGDISVGAVVAQWVQRGRGLALGVVYTGSNLGGAAAAFGMAALAASASWRVAVATAVGVGLFVLLPAACWMVRERDAPAEAEEVAEGEGAEAAASLPLAAALRTRSFWILAFTLVVFWAYLMTVLQHFVLALVDAGFAAEAAGAQLSRLVFMGLFSKIAFGLLADRLSAKGALMLDFGLLAGSSLLLLALPAGPAITGFVLLFGFSYAARDVVTPLAIAYCFGARHLAQIYGALMLTILPGGALGPIFAGWIHDRSGSYFDAFATIAALNILGLFLLLTIRNERAQQ